jgi:hypothetical protein
MFWYFFLEEGDSGAGLTSTPALQATLFPEQVTPPAIQPLPLETSSAPASEASEVAPAGVTPGVFATPLVATLTPWPTNTSAP